jgi:hypothetical protein
MEQLMAASDVVVTKAGPGTLMEALVMRRPVVITEAVGMQEQGNIAFVVDRGLGAYSKHIPEIVAAVTDLRNPDIHSATVARLANAVPRDGAKRIADIILAQLELNPPVITKRTLMPTVPRWLRRRDVNEGNSRRVRLLNLDILERLRQHGGLTVSWPRRARRKNRK